MVYMHTTVDSKEGLNREILAENYDIDKNIEFVITANLKPE